MSRKKSFFKDVTFYSCSAIFANIMNFIIGVVIRRILQPALMGLFNEIMLIFEYMRYSHFGMMDSLDKELPYFYGMKNYEKVEEVKNTGFTVCLAVALSVSIGLLFASFAVTFTEDKLLINGVRIILLLVPLQMVASLYIVLNRSRNRFTVISKYIILVAILDLVAKILLILRFGLYGLLWASILTTVLGLIYFYRASEEKLKFIFRFSFAEVARLFKIGFPIFIMGFIFMTLRSIDRIMIIRLLDRESLGFYTIALMCSAYLIQLPNLVYAVIFPRFYQAYGEKQNILELKELFIKPTLVFAYTFPILIGATILLLPFIVHYILPAYTPGLIPAYILLLGASFISLVNMPGYLLIVLNKQTRMVVIGVLSIFLGATLIYLFVRKFHLGLSGVAIGAALTYFLYATILMAYAFKNYTKHLLTHLKFFVELYFPFLWMLMLLSVLKFLVFTSSGSMAKDFFMILFKEVFFLLGCIPLVLYVNKKTAIIPLLRQAYSRKRHERKIQK